MIQENYIFFEIRIKCIVKLYSTPLFDLMHKTFH